MAKLRNASTDVGKLVQWIGRKCRNHHPLSEVAGASASTPTKAVSKVRLPGPRTAVFTRFSADAPILYYQEKGRIFRITVEEVEPESVPTTDRIDCGY